MSGFNDPVVGGGGTLIRSAIHSPNYVAGVSGWSINKDGTAQFNSISVLGTIQVADGFGNTLANIDALGNITGQTVSANTDLLLQGVSLVSELNALPEGVLFRTGILGQQTLPFPTVASGSEVSMWELDVALSGGRTYEFHIAPIRVNLSLAGSAEMTIYYTTDGSTPTTASSVFAKDIEVTSGTNANQPVTMQIHHEYSPLLDKTYRFLVAMKPTGRGSGTPNWQIQSTGDNGLGLGAMWIVDLGPDPGDTGVWIGTGTGGGTGTQNFTKSYNASHTYAYEGTNGDSSPNPGFSPGAKINTDGNATQGDDQLGDNGNTSTMITWPGSVATDVAGATITSITLTLNNNHSWFNSGMTVAIGKHNGSAGGSTRPTYTDPDLVEGSISEGSTKTFSLNGQLSAFSNALVNGNPFTLYHPGSSRNYYGYFAGAGQSGPPKLTVKYTK